MRHRGGGGPALALRAPPAAAPSACPARGPAPGNLSGSRPTGHLLNAPPVITDKGSRHLVSRRTPRKVRDRGTGTPPGFGALGAPGGRHFLPARAARRGRRGS